MSGDLREWIARHGLERSAELLGIDVRLAKDVAAGRQPPSEVMRKLAMAIDRIAELESQLKRDSFLPGRPAKIKAGTPLPPRPDPILKPAELQAEMDWVRGRS